MENLLVYWSVVLPAALVLCFMAGYAYGYYRCLRRQIKKRGATPRSIY